MAKLWAFLYQLWDHRERGGDPNEVASLFRAVNSNSLALGKELVSQHLRSELARQEHCLVRKKRTPYLALVRVAEHLGHLVGGEEEAAHHLEQQAQGTQEKGGCSFNLLLRLGSCCQNMTEEEGC